ncbi:hypothetical protein OG599_34960 (plasmid) [Streptomyces sp. NBC_01335]|uniref:hypothetical protein n=1 Tax=Streptomyces sp. NBC_01335 TaxID=2903828 RepID=UPI002E148529|nr:hypothetical protein OG599_34960 [Streptomyces sp. NBC_01335]
MAIRGSQHEGNQMKVTVFQFEGTAEELDASSILAELTRHHGGAVSVSARGGPGSGPQPARIPGVPDEGQETVRQLLNGNRTADLFVRFLDEATRWDNVGVYGIKSKNALPDAPLDYSRYLRLRRQGSQFGGFAYVYAGSSTINLRLAYSQQQLNDLGVTTARILTTGYPAYRVSVDLIGEAPLADALRLAQLAYNAT